VVPQPAAAELLGRRPGAVGVARADHDFGVGLDQPRRERAAEWPRTTQDRDPHTGAPRTASATRRRASASLISVLVTIIRTPESPASAASASSITRASSRPL